MTVNELFEKIGPHLLVLDAETDENNTAISCKVLPMALVHIWASAQELATVVIQDPKLIREMYDHPSAESYGDGSYTIKRIAAKGKNHG